MMGNCLRRTGRTPRTAERNQRLHKEDVVHPHNPHGFEIRDIENNVKSPLKPHAIHVQINTVGIADVELAYIKLYTCVSEIINENSLQPASNQFIDKFKYIIRSPVFPFQYRRIDAKRGFVVVSPIDYWRM